MRSRCRSVCVAPPPTVTFRSSCWSTIGLSKPLRSWMVGGKRATFRCRKEWRSGITRSSCGCRTSTRRLTTILDDRRRLSSLVRGLRRREGHPLCRLELRRVEAVVDDCREDENEKHRDHERQPPKQRLLHGKRRGSFLHVGQRDGVQHGARVEIVFC